MDHMAESRALDAKTSLRPFQDDVAEAAFRWSLTLVSKILVRTVLEGASKPHKGPS